jgi:hypothetical protein
MIEQTRWLKRVGSSSERISTRRLRKSIQAGRLLNAEEIKLDPADRGIPNHIPQVNRLCAWWAGLQRERWLEKASPQQRAQLKRDLLPIMQIYERL